MTAAVDLLCEGLQNVTLYQAALQRARRRFSVETRSEVEESLPAGLSGAALNLSLCSRKSWTWWSTEELVKDHGFVQPQQLFAVWGHHRTGGFLEIPEFLCQQCSRDLVSVSFLCVQLEGEVVTKNWRAQWCENNVTGPESGSGQNRSAEDLTARCEKTTNN